MSNALRQEELFAESFVSNGHASRKFSQLEAGLRITWQPELKHLVNFRRNSELPVHNWFFYREGYCGKLVDYLLSRAGEQAPKTIVIDPFCGCGTTLVSAKQKGFASLGVDVNPVSVFISSTKITNYSENEIGTFERIVSSYDARRAAASERIPRLGILQDVFSAAALEGLMKIKGLYENCDNRKARELIKLAFLAIVEPSSNRKKDGNGIKRIVREHEPKVEFLFKEKCRQISKDLRGARRRNKSNAEVVLGDAKELSGIIGAKTDLIRGLDRANIIFSPPYANCFDYCEVYKLELWMGDFVGDYGDFKQFRDPAVRSHVNAPFSKIITNEMAEVEEIATEVARTDVWNRNIPDMLRGYFDDMTKALEEMFNLPFREVTCSVVVANSAYRGIVVPTDLLLAKIASRIGFEVEKIEVCRPLRSSPQQMRQLSRYRNYLRESLITLRR